MPIESTSEFDELNKKISEISEKNKKSYENTNWKGKFWEYLTLLEENPYKYSRTAFQYIHDMIEYYGSEEFEDAGEKVIRYKLFDDQFTNGLKKIFGLERTIMKLFRYIKSGAREEGKERIFVFILRILWSQSYFNMEAFRGLAGWRWVFCLRSYI